MKLLIIGGTGIISRAIVQCALDSGFDVTIVNRGTRKIGFENRVHVIQADRQDKEGFREKLKSAQPDVVIDMICFDPEDAAQTVEIFRHRVRQLIFASSVAAYDRPYKSLPTREDAEKPLVDTDFSYGKQKAAFEQYLLGEMKKDEMKKNGAAITIIRPSLTFGPGARNFGMLRQNYNVVQRIRDGRPLVMVGEGTFPWSFTYVDDLARGFVLACGNERTYNDHFQVLNDEVVVWEDIYRAIGSLVGKEPILYRVPSVLLKEIDEKLMGHLNYEKVYCSVFSIEKFQKAVPEFRPACRFREGIAKVVESWEKESLGVDVAKDAFEDKICACYEAFRESLYKLRDHPPFSFSFK
ncbi:MAG: NAD-dependent epimerase/dehydratase family protein [Synergistaceae bacterium]|jgi:nucleoside-diphosphate-sugar epimerase|nr:NAD-dependent epimerase/dehydratase family protein [Synergistaceae bacterium]